MRDRKSTAQMSLQSMTALLLSPLVDALTTTESCAAAVAVEGTAIMLLLHMATEKSQSMGTYLLLMPLKAKK